MHKHTVKQLHLHLSAGLAPQLNQQESPVDSDERGGGKRGRKIKKLKWHLAGRKTIGEAQLKTPYSLVYGVHCVCKEEQILEISIGIIMHHNKN